MCAHPVCASARIVGIAPCCLVQPRVRCACSSVKCPLDRLCFLSGAAFLRRGARGRHFGNTDRNRARALGTVGRSTTNAKENSAHRPGHKADTTQLTGRVTRRTRHSSQAGSQGGHAAASERARSGQADAWAHANRQSGGARPVQVQDKHAHTCTSVIGESYKTGAHGSRHRRTARASSSCLVCAAARPGARGRQPHGTSSAQMWCPDAVCSMCRRRACGDGGECAICPGSVRCERGGHPALSTLFRRCMISR
jgi:hypothetical protein